jgi:hypothetical protein
MNHPLDSVRRAMMEFRQKARDWIEKGWAGCRFVSQWQGSFNAHRELD